MRIPSRKRLPAWICFSATIVGVETNTIESRSALSTSAATNREHCERPFDDRQTPCASYVALGRLHHYRMMSSSFIPHFSTSCLSIKRDFSGPHFDQLPCSRSGSLATALTGIRQRLRTTHPAHPRPYRPCATITSAASSPFSPFVGSPDARPCHRSSCCGQFRSHLLLPQPPHRLKCGNRDPADPCQRRLNQRSPRLFSSALPAAYARSLRPRRDLHPARRQGRGSGCPP